MTKQVFVINGSGGVGKDTFVYLVTIASGHKALQFSSVDRVKNIARQIGWNGQKDEKSRKFLSDLKILCSDFCDMPFKSMMDVNSDFQKRKQYEMIFFHIREPEEIARAVRVFGAKTILMERSNVPHIISNMADGGVYNYSYDITIHNDGDISDLKSKAEKFYSDFKNGTLATTY